MTSPAQKAANRRNAEQSTGPRTDDGKKRAAMNAMKHGGYVEQYGSIAATILKEDHDVVQTLIDALVEDLDPATPVEYMQAQSIAQKIVSQQRIDRLAYPLATSQEFGPLERVDLDGPDQESHAFWGDIDAAMDVLEGRVQGKVESEQLALELSRRAPGSGSQVNRYSDDRFREPASDLEWDAKLVSLVRGLVGAGDTGLGIINRFKQLAADSALREERTVAGIEAKRLLEQFRDLTDVQDRVQRMLARDLKAYWELKDRNETATT
jgi:hypothetical protein